MIAAKSGVGSRLTAVPRVSRRMSQKDVHPGNQFGSASRQSGSELWESCDTGLPAQSSGHLNEQSEAHWRKDFSRQRSTSELAA
jgi:hypothetical protein